MRLRDVEVERFAQLRDLAIHDIGDGVTVIYGDNESGKTSLMEFIRSGMFEAGKGRRYPQPDRNDGGSLVLEMDDGTPIHLERRKNKIRNTDGGPLPGEIFHSLDLKTYESIFAMGLEDLMDHSRITDDSQLKGRFLTVAGTRNLLPFRQECERELDNMLGKRRSRDSNRIMERKMAEIDDLEEKREVLQSSLDLHASLVDELEECLSRKAALGERERHLRKEQARWGKALEQWPNWQRKKGLEADILRYAYSETFPHDGLEEYRRLGDELEELQSSLDDLHRRSEGIVLSDEWPREGDEELVSLSTRIRSLCGMRGQYRNDAERTESLLRTVDELESRQGHSASRLGWTGTSPLQAVVDIGLEETLRRTEESLSAKRQELFRMESEIKTLSDETPHDQEDVTAGLRKVQHLLGQRTRYREMERDAEERKRMLSLRRRVLYAASLLSALLGTALIILGELPVAMVCYAGSAGTFIWGTLSKDDLLHTAEEEMRSLGSDMAEEASMLGVRLEDAALERHMEDLLNGLGSDVRKRERSADKDMALTRLQEDREGLISSIETTESDFSIELASRGFPENLGTEGCRTALSMILQMRERQENLDGNREELKRLTDRNSACESEAEELAGRLGILCSGFIPCMDMMESMLEDAEGRQRSHEDMDKDTLRIRRDMEDMERTMKEKKARLDDLRSVAGNEEDFLRMGEDNHRLLEDRKSLYELRRLMLTTLGGDDGLEKMEAVMESCDVNDIQDSLSETENELKDVTSELEDLNRQHGSLSGEIKGLHAMEGIASASQELESARKEMADLVRRYARTSLALNVLNMACDGFMREKQPRVIGSANGYLELMTGGRYRMALDPETMEVRVRSPGSGSSKGDGQWSSGLGDQIHLSLRLAMAEEMSGEESLPVILDDVLVRFDGERRRGAAESIRRYAENGGRQVLLFTCSREVEDTFRKMDGGTSFIRMDGSAVHADPGPE